MSTIVEGFGPKSLVGKSYCFEPVDIDLIERNLSPGLYDIGCDNNGWYVTKQVQHTDKLIALGGESAVNSILSEVRRFLSPKTAEIMQDFNLVHRRGILLYGPPGSGKTSIINLLVEELAKSHNVVSFLNPHPSHFSHIGKKIHKLDPKQFMLVVYEDFEEWSDDPDLLALLDGQNSVPNTIYLATTNYFDQLEKRIVDRPSRFATKIEVAAPPISVRLEFLKRHIPAKYQESVNLTDWAEKTEGLMIDHLKHLAQYVFVFGYDVDKAIATLRSFATTELDGDDDEE